MVEYLLYLREENGETSGDFRNSGGIFGDVWETRFGARRVS
jgi:hypothetical protein